MRRGYPTKRQYERSLYREPYLAASAARGYEARKGWEQDHNCGACARFDAIEIGPLVGAGACEKDGSLVAAGWSRPCWQAKTVPTDPTHPAAVLRALVLQQPVERTPDGLRAVSADDETDARGET